MNELQANALTLNELAERMLEHEDPAVKVFAKKFIEEYTDDLKDELEEFLFDNLSTALHSLADDVPRKTAKEVVRWMADR